MNDLWPNSHLWLAWSAYLLMTASPGPSNMATMGIAMTTGRRDALTFAAGVMCGSCFWGVTAAMGLSTLLLQYAHGMTVLKLLGGLYLLWLGIKSARSAWHSSPLALATQSATASTPRQLYLRGLGLHLTNPKAILSWFSVVAVSLTPGAAPTSAMVVVASCVGLGVCVFGGYAIAFSSPVARRAYTAARRPIESIFALMFGYAGLRLMLSRAP